MNTTKQPNPDREKLLIAAAAKVKNQVVRNVLLATVTAGRSTELAERLARAEIRSASTTSQAARAEQKRFCLDAIAAGRTGDGIALATAVTLTETADRADESAEAAKEALHALREGRNGQGGAQSEEQA